MSGVGDLLSEYRKSRRMSQLDLSALSEVSSRHISFIESGRSNPSREMLLRLSDVLDLPLRDSNLLLSAAGFSMSFANNGIDDEQMQPVKNALEIMLENHNPYPAIVMDSCWNMVMMNTAQTKLFSLIPGLLVPKAEGLGYETFNVLEVLFDQNAVRPIIKNWDELASFLLRRLRKQALAFKQPNTKNLFNKLLNMNPPENWAQPSSAKLEGPMISAEIALGEVTLKIFSTLSQFGSALDVGMEELVIESYFPTDDFTKDFFKNLS